MLAALLLVAPLLNEGDEPQSDRGPLVLRVHSLAGMVEHRGSSDGALELLPYRICTMQMPPDLEYGEGPCALDAEDVCALVREVVEPQLWMEVPGAGIDLRGGNAMVVIAPQEVQGEVARFLEVLSGALVPTEALEVRVLPAEAADVAGAELALDVAEADRRIAARGLRRFAATSLRGSAVVRAEDVDRGSIVYDYEIEIAQGSTISDPVVESVTEGLSVVARATRVEGGELVNVIVRASERAAPTVKRRLTAKALVNAKPVMSERLAAGIFEHPQLSFASFAGTVFLPEGKAVWIPVTIETHLGVMSFCLDLRVSGRLPPVRSSFEPRHQPDADSMRFVLVSRGAADLGIVEIERAPANLFNAQWTHDGSSPIWARLPAQDQDGVLVDLVQRTAAEAFDSGHGGAGYAGGSVRTWLPAPFSERANAALEPLQRFEASVLLRGRLLVDGEERGKFRVPTVVGRPVALWAGVQGTRISHWDVDVANEAQSCNPSPEAWVDGFAFRLEIARNVAGEFVVDVNGKTCLLDGPPKAVELEDDSRLTVDHVQARSCYLDELRTLPSQGGRVKFGGGVSLELEVVVPANH